MTEFGDDFLDHQRQPMKEKIDRLDLIQIKISLERHFQEN